MMSEIDSLSAPDWHWYSSPAVLGHAVGELVGGGVERVAGAGREPHPLAVPLGHAAAGAALAVVDDADHGRAVAVVGVPAERVVVVVVDAAQVLVGLVDLVVADRVVVAVAGRVVRHVAAALVVEDLAVGVARVLVRVVGVPAGALARLAAVGAGEDRADRLADVRADLAVEAEGEHGDEDERHDREHAGVRDRCLSALSVPRRSIATRLPKPRGRDKRRGAQPPGARRPRPRVGRAYQSRRSARRARRGPPRSTRRRTPPPGSPRAPPPR